MRSDAQLAPIPVILMSAVRRQVAMRSGEDFPTFSMFLRKPFFLRTLMEAIIKFVGQAE